MLDCLGKPQDAVLFLTAEVPSKTERTKVEIPTGKKTFLKVSFLSQCMKKPGPRVCRDINSQVNEGGNL